MSAGPGRIATAELTSVIDRDRPLTVEFSEYERDRLADGGTGRHAVGGAALARDAGSACRRRAKGQAARMRGHERPHELPPPPCAR
jgi:hypothetical protein